MNENTPLSLVSEYAYLPYRKGAGRSGPCNPGGASPSMLDDRSRITGPIFTGRGLPTGALLQIGFLEPNSAPVGVPASSGLLQSLDETKAIRLAPFPTPLEADGTPPAGRRAA
jgi:hypothetical protein